MLGFATFQLLACLFPALGLNPGLTLRFLRTGNPLRFAAHTFRSLLLRNGKPLRFRDRSGFGPATLVLTGLRFALCSFRRCALRSLGVASRAFFIGGVLPFALAPLVFLTFGLPPGLPFGLTLRFSLYLGLLLRLATFAVAAFVFLTRSLRLGFAFRGSGGFGRHPCLLFLGGAAFSFGTRGGLALALKLFLGRAFGGSPSFLRLTSRSFPFCGNSGGIVGDNAADTGGKSRVIGALKHQNLCKPQRAQGGRHHSIGGDRTDFLRRRAEVFALDQCDARAGRLRRDENRRIERTGPDLRPKILR